MTLIAVMQGDLYANTASLCAQRLQLPPRQQLLPRLQLPLRLPQQHLAVISGLRGALQALVVILVVHVGHGLKREAV